jgi:hypothetical protein
MSEVFMVSEKSFIELLIVFAACYACLGHLGVLKLVMLVGKQWSNIIKINPLFAAHLS